MKRRAAILFPCVHISSLGDQQVPHLATVEISRPMQRSHAAKSLRFHIRASFQQEANRLDPPLFGSIMQRGSPAIIPSIDLSAFVPQLFRVFYLVAAGPPVKGRPATAVAGADEQTVGFQKSCETL